MKKFFKFIGIGFVALIILGVFASMGSESEPTTGEVKSTDHTEKEVEAEKKEEPKKETAINRENYDKIIVGDVLTGNGGSSLDEVVALLGEPDSKSESQIDETVVKYYDWSDLWGSGITISVTFSDDKVSDKMIME